MCKIVKMFVLLAGVMVGALVCPAETIVLRGIVRDFTTAHPDFESDDVGEDPGMVQLLLGWDKKPVYAGLEGNPTTHGQEYFDQWYRDVPGVNMSGEVAITLDNSLSEDPDIYTYLNEDFFPIDGQLLGNQENPHNYHFTYELHSTFTYQGGELFTFTGDDDLWVFINDHLVIDLGGVHFPQVGTVALDEVAGEIGIEVDRKYDIDIFFAERHTTFSHFQIDTSLALASEPECIYDVPGDLNRDCRVNLLDFQIMAFYWLTDCLADPGNPLEQPCVLRDDDRDGYHILIDPDDNDCAVW